MKRHSLLCCLTLFLTFGYSQISFKEVCEKSDFDNKHITFVHMHTEWCGLCRLMEKTVYTDVEVANYHNENFSNLIWNPEMYLPEIANKWNIRAFPTILYIDHNGKILYRYTGALKKEELLTISKKIIDIMDEDLSDIEIIKYIDHMDYYGRRKLNNHKMIVISTKDSINREELDFLIKHISESEPGNLNSIANRIAKEPLSFKQKRETKTGIVTFQSTYLLQHKDENDHTYINSILENIPPKINPHK